MNTPALRPNETVGPYRIVEQIGAGGMAVVYKAHDSLIDRFVAIKHISDAGDDERQQLRQEAQAHKKLTHNRPPDLVQLLDIIEDDRGVMLISEFVEGESLEQILRRSSGPMDEARACRILKHIAKALATIHGHGMLHRDLKPANVLLDAHDRVKVTDFGLAVAMAEQQVMHVGSVRYMAPELLRGEKADARADMYSLGMIGYEMLAGRAKFDQAFSMVLRDQRNAAMRWMKWHTNPRAVAPPLTQWQPGLSPRLAELIARLMDKAPQRRVASADEFLAAMDRLDDAPIASITEPDISQPLASSADDTAPIPRARRLVRSLSVTLSILVLLGAVLGANLWRLQALKQQQREQAAMQILDDAKAAFGEQRYLDAHLLYQQVASAPWLAQSDLAVAARRGAKVSRGQSHLSDERFQEAAQVFREAQTLDPTTANELEPWIKQAEQRGAFASAVHQIDTQIAGDQLNDARKLIRQWQPLAITPDEVAQLRGLREKLADRRTRREAESAIDRAHELIDQGRRSEAIDLLNDAASQYATHRPVRQLYEKLLADQAYDEAITRGRAAQEVGDPQTALEAYREAIAIAPSGTLDLTISRLESERLLAEGLTLLNAGDTAQAERLLILALGKNQNNVRALKALKHIESANRMQVFVDAGDTAVVSNDYATAIRHYENALKMGVNESVMDKLLDVRVRKLLDQATTTLENAEVDAAVKLLKQARQIDPTHPMLARVGNDITTRGKYFRYLAQGDEAREQSEFPDAKRYYARARRVMDTPEIRQRLDDAEYAHLLAQAAAYIEQEDYFSAKALLRIALQLQDTQQVRSLLEKVLEKEPDTS